MNKSTQQNEKTHDLLIRHLHAYPNLQIEDIFKYLFQSAFGCEHFVPDEDAAVQYIKREFDAVPKASPPMTDRLDGEYSRVYLSHLNSGLQAQTLARLFCRSAKKEPLGESMLEQKLQIAAAMVADGTLPFDSNVFDQKVAEWKAMGYPAVHHSDIFRATYHPAYRVVANRYAQFLQMFSKIDRLLERGNTIVAIEGGSASGKTTLASMLQEIYDCNVFHTDDFFLRPTQRTPQRMSEIGGNLDRERFSIEVLQPLKSGETVQFRRYDCASQTLREPITVLPKKLTVIEGVYAMHPAFGDYYDISIFLDVAPEVQKARIKKRNTPPLARRFFEEWIPLENAYFSQMRIKSRCTESVTVE